MKARLIATGERAPAWVAQGFAEYQKRLSHWLPFELVEVAPGLRGKHRDAQRAIEDEGQRVLAALPKGAHIVALEVTGKQHSSEQLAQRLEHWRGQGRDLAFLIGGPEGHSPDVLAAAHDLVARPADPAAHAGQTARRRAALSRCGHAGQPSLPPRLIRLAGGGPTGAGEDRRRRGKRRMPHGRSAQAEVHRNPAVGLHRVAVLHGRLELPRL